MTGLLIYILPVLAIGLLFAGCYAAFFQKTDQAQAVISQLLNTSTLQQDTVQLQKQHLIFKRKRKTENRLFQKWDIDLEQANLLIKPIELLWIMLGAGVISFIISMVLGKGIFLSIIFGIVGFFLPQAYLKMRIMMRMSKARAQFADVLDTLVNCFKSGYGFSRAIQVVAENFEDPWSTELNKVATEMNLGVGLEEALSGLARRIPNPDVALFVTAILIQKETGGNLAQLLNNLSATIRERYKLLSKVSALSAQGKLSAIMVFCIPFGLAGTFNLLMPQMMQTFFHHPIGIALTVVAGLLQLIGGVVLKKIVSLEV